MTDGANAMEFKVSRAYQIGDMGFHSQVAIKCNTRFLTESEKGTDALTTGIEYQKKKRQILTFDLRIRSLLQSCRSVQTKSRSSNLD